MKGGTRLSSAIFPGLILVIELLALGSGSSDFGRMGCSKKQCGGSSRRDCCPDYVCNIPKKHAAWGSCVPAQKSLPSTSNGLRKNEAADCAEGQNAVCGGQAGKKCCTGFGCLALKTKAGSPGRCMPILQSFTSNGSEKNETANCAEGQNAECAGEAAKKCCPGYSCLALKTKPGSSGRCMPNSPPPANSGLRKNGTANCAQGQNAVCGGQAAVKCCAGLSCLSLKKKAGSPGRCMQNPLPPTSWGARKNGTGNCAKGQNAVCGGQAGKKCCPGFGCLALKTKAGSPGRCMPVLKPFTSNGSEKNETLNCAEGKHADCGGKAAKKCCPGYSCLALKTKPGSPGKCMQDIQDETESLPSTTSVPEENDNETESPEPEYDD